jgi:hypothetical protein
MMTPRRDGLLRESSPRQDPFVNVCFSSVSCRCAHDVVGSPWTEERRKWIFLADCSGETGSEI